MLGAQNSGKFNAVLFTFPSCWRRINEYKGLTKILLCAIYGLAIVILDRKSVRKPRNILIDPDTLHKAHIEVLRSKKTLREWREEAIEEKIEREEKKVK